MDIPNLYAHPHYRRLFIIPVVLVLISLILILFVSPIRMGIDFKGGIDVNIQSNNTVDTAALSKIFDQAGYHVEQIDSKPDPGGYSTQVELQRSALAVQADADRYDFSLLKKTAEDDESLAYGSNDTDAQAAFVISRKAMDVSANKIFLLANVSDQAANYTTTSQLDKAVGSALSALNERERTHLRDVVAAAVPGSSASFDEVTSSLSAKFFEIAVGVVIFSILLTTAVVFVIFRTVVPSIAVLTGALSDVLMAMGAMALFGIPLTLASFSALMMLVGFSLDTDVLLTMRVIKRHEGTASQRAYDAMKTGGTMSLSAIVAFSALLALALVTRIPIYYQIAAVAIAGLVGDLIATWCFNAVIVLHYAEEQQKKGTGGPERPLWSFFFRP